MNVSRMGIQMKRIRGALAKMFGPWIADFVIMGLIPQIIGRYRVVDILLAWAEDEQE
jgi:hypothetical protein